MWLIKNMLGHIKTVHRHKKEVLRLCCIAGIPWRGLVHDMSKFSPTELIESAIYFQGGSKSPLGACEDENGYSKAWLHHKGRNKHHIEYYQYDLANVCSSGKELPLKETQWCQYDEEMKGYAVRMPWAYSVECACDMISASKTYKGSRFAHNDPYLFWKKRMANKNCIVHSDTDMFISILLKRYAEHGEAALRRRYTKRLFNEISRRASMRET